MPLVERIATAAFPSTTALSGPFYYSTTMNAKPSSRPLPTLPTSPDAVSTALPTGKPPISPPIATGARMAPLPTLVRLPSLTRASLHHRPSVIPTPQAQTRLTPVAVPLPASPPQRDGERPSPRELAARLALLLHARECCTPLDMERVCGVRNCRVARGVLDHCQECFLAEGQCHRSCSEAKQLLRHFRVCRAQQFARACPICDLLRSEFGWAMQHARSLTPLFVPRTSTDQDVFQQEHEPVRRHSSYHPEPLEPRAVPTTSLRRSVSEGPHATMSATGHHHKRSAVLPPSGSGYIGGAIQGTPTVKRVRIVTPTEEAEAAARATTRA